MPAPLSRYALRLLQNEAGLKSSLTSPLLVWEAPPDNAEESVMPTMSGAESRERPSEGNSLVFELRKDPLKTNAFAMGVTVGRTPNNDVVLPDHSISRFHGYFQQDSRTGAWRLVDAESRNGTQVGGAKLLANTPLVLTDGSRIRFGDVDLLFFEPSNFVEWLRKRMES